MAQILGMYGYSQISYGASDPFLSNEAFYPYFRTLPNYHVQCTAIVKLLHYFGWNWVGILTSDDDSGDRESQLLETYSAGYGICIEFTIKMSRQDELASRVHKHRKTIQQSSCQIIVLCGTVSFFVLHVFHFAADILIKKTFILFPTWLMIDQIQVVCPEAFHGSLGLVVHVPKKSKMEQFLERYTPSNYPRDMLLEDIWMLNFECLSTNPHKNLIFETLYRIKLRNCSLNIRLSMTEGVECDGNCPQVGGAVHLFAHALDQMRLLQNTQILEKHRNSPKNRHQLYQNLKTAHYVDESNSVLRFDENGDMIANFSIFNSVLLRDIMIVNHYIGKFSPQASMDKQLSINMTKITWKSQSGKVPSSRCSFICPHGYRKAPRKEEAICCHDCVECSEDEIANKTDSENCIKCLHHEWPNKRKDECVPKLVEFLSYTENVIARVFAFLSILFCVLTAVTLGVFILFRNTPIVRANNKDLSFLLLVSIMLIFLSVFLFLGRPVDITCKLRQTTFGIIFSISVSAILAKTIMVCVAFRVTKPDSFWKKWIGVNIAKFIVFLGSFFQVIISICWLSTFPPFQEFDLHSYPGKIIIQCNEGSVTAFYSVLGYMGILAAVSFLLAFMVRTLPDSFNEAKYITFSMLVFCSVWIAMIPAYLSTKGKDMVSVEIFAILASNAALLVFIFFPKCYVIIFTPHLNAKVHIETRFG
uniref:G-protein coupled receptors family 3 profile domain-containing protein n=1 Tax=Leptobrachium leishanense TaxID=445787 RepID=A0A8C5W6D4_9ANUR